MTVVHNTGRATLEYLYRKAERREYVKETNPNFGNIYRSKRRSNEELEQWRAERIALGLPAELVKMTPREVATRFACRGTNTANKARREAVSLVKMSWNNDDDLKSKRQLAEEAAEVAVQKCIKTLKFHLQQIAEAGTPNSQFPVHVRTQFLIEVIYKLGKSTVPETRINLDLKGQQPKQGAK